MLRPATPLTVLLFVAFILLLISVISTPVVKSIPLASFHGVDFGVFGYCRPGGCSGIKIGYGIKISDNGGDGGKDYSLPLHARSSLSSLLIVHPIAAFLTLICLVLAGSAHLHAPSHSPRYLLVLLILLLPTLLITLLAFLVDILLFVPHLAWAGWIVLGSTILITASGVVTCAMRRTLVSRKARKKRIAANADMNGESYYSGQDTHRAESPPPLDAQSTAPMVNGAPGADKLPNFTTYDAKDPRVMEEERIPLNTRTPSNRTVPSSGTRPEASEDGYDRYGGPGRGGLGGIRGGRGGQYNGPRDEYGNPLPPSNAFGPIPPGAIEMGLRRQYSNETMNSQGSRRRGRGGYPPRSYGRGGYGPGRGSGINGNGRAMPMGPAGGPPPDYGNYPPQGRGVPAQYNRDMSGPAPYGRDPSASGYGRRASPGPPSAAGYGRRPSPGPPSAPGVSARQPSPGPPSAPGVYGYGREPSPGPSGVARYRTESPPPPIPDVHHNESHVIGQAVEMDAFTGSPSHTPVSNRPMQLQSSDNDIQATAGLQQQDHRESPLSLTSVYSSQDAYVPAHAAWAASTARTHTPPPNKVHPLSPIRASPIELPARTPSHSPNPQLPTPQPPTPPHVRTNLDGYYEDVDPRFADPRPPQLNFLTPNSNHPNGTSQSPVDRNGSPAHIEHSTSYESIPDGAHSHTSDASNYTSISQRGINPNWRPAPGPQGIGMGGVPDRRPMQQQRDILLQTNPDFEIPESGRGGRMIGLRGGRGGTRAPGMIPGMGPGAPGRYPRTEM